MTGSNAGIIERAAVPEEKAIVLIERQCTAAATRRGREWDQNGDAEGRRGDSCEDRHVEVCAPQPPPIPLVSVLRTRLLEWSKRKKQKGIEREGPGISTSASSSSNTTCSPDIVV